MKDNVCILIPTLNEGKTIRDLVARFKALGYEDVLVIIDPERLLNNGQPSLLTLLIDSLDLERGDRAVHIGCGTGYYTALIAEIVGPSGHVTAIEIDPGLPARARDGADA